MLLENMGLISIVMLMILNDISTRPVETSKLSKLMACVKKCKDWITNNFLLLDSDKTEILLIGPNKTVDRISWIAICN